MGCGWKRGSLPFCSDPAFSMFEVPSLVCGGVSLSPADNCQIVVLRVAYTI